MSSWNPLKAMLALGLVVLLVSACERDSKPQALLPQGKLPAGWRPADEAVIYVSDNLYDLVDGQSDSFYAYGFQQVTTQNLTGPDDAIVTVQLWQLDEPANAYGLFTASAAGTPVEIGNDGDGDAGRRLYFWQNRYTVQITSRQPMDNTDLLTFGQALAAALPQGGEPTALLANLPQAGRTADRPLFFHEELSLQNALWLGGENVLGLGPDTDGLLARYDLDGQPAQLLLVVYPRAEQAATARDALQAGRPDELVAASIQEEMLAAVFGQVDLGAAERLIAEALP